MSHESLRVASELGREQRLDGWSNAVDDRTQIRRLFLFRSSELLESRQNGATARVAQYDDERCAEPLRGELDAADLGRRDDVAGDADDEQVAQPLVEDNLRWDSRVRTAEDNCEWLLTCSELTTSCLSQERVDAAHPRREASVSCS